MGEVIMKRMTIFSLTVSIIFAVAAINPVVAKEKNLTANKAVTAKIRALDQEFFKGFDVYSAGAEEEPTALLFDIKDDEYQLPDRFWGKPLTGEEISYAIRRLDDEYLGGVWYIPFWPEGLNIVNSKGVVQGYVYTGLGGVFMDRKKDGRTTVFLPRPRLIERLDQ
jgi:hypothetical protein